MPSNESKPPVVPTQPKQFRSLPEGATVEQLLHSLNEMAVAYANIAHQLTHEIPKLRATVDALTKELAFAHAAIKRLDKVLEDIGEELVRQMGEIHELKDNMRSLTGRVEKLETAARSDAPERPSNESLPPMRPESDSSHDLAKHVSGEMAKAVIADKRLPSLTPPMMEVLTEVSEPAVIIAIDRLKAKQWDEKLAAEKKAAEEKAAFEQRAAVEASIQAEKLRLEHVAREAEKRRFRYTTAGSIILAVASLIAFVVEHWFTAHTMLPPGMPPGK